jgi:photosystem II stability/assembly factor-like uncharacterized protein
MARGEPCPQGSGRTGEVDSVAVSAGAAGRVTVLCRPRLPGQSDFVVTSADAGAHFSAAAAGRLPQQTELLAGDYHGTLLAGGSTGVYRSTDGGASWQRVAQLGAVKFLGFESPSVARAVSADGRTIWSTPDGGVQWFANP